ALRRSRVKKRNPSRRPSPRKRGRAGDRDNSVRVAADLAHPGDASFLKLLLSCVLGQANAGELPACLRWKEIAVGRPDVRSGRCTRAATQYELVAHELCVIFAKRASRWSRAWVRGIRAPCPLPNVPKTLSKFRANLSRPRMKTPRFEEITIDLLLNRRRFPLGLGWQPRARPASICIGFIKAHVTDRFRRIQKPRS